MAINLTKGTEVEWRACINEKIKEVKENMSIKFWHESNQFCRDWWDSIEENDYMKIAEIKIGCISIEARIDRYNSAISTVSYYLNTKMEDETWEESGCIIPDHIEFISSITTWEDLFNNMLYNLIVHCLDYEIDYEADYYIGTSDLIKNLQDKLSAERIAYIKSIKDKDEAISWHYKITMFLEFEKAIPEIVKKLTNKQIRERFLQQDNLLENLFYAFCKRETGEMEVYKEFINDVTKELK